MASNEPAAKQSAAFFDIDGTLVETTIVHYYVYFRRRRMSAIWSRIWSVAYLFKCGYYLLLDKLDRSRMNVVFYRSYAGMSVEEIKSQVGQCHQDVIEPRRFAEAAGEVAAQRDADRRIVFVTGSIDFIIDPLAKQLGVDDVLAPALITQNGRFTGQLDGPPIGGQEKARRMRAFAETHAIDLPASHAYGDSIADLPMLETVGHAHAVNPDKALAAIANERGWPIHRWSVRRGAKGDGR